MNPRFRSALALLFVSAIATIARADTALIATDLQGAVTVEIQDAQGQPLRSINGTLLPEGVIVPISAFNGAAKAVVKARGGQTWTVENTIASNAAIDIALLALPEPPQNALSLPADASFMPGSRIELLNGPGADVDSIGATAYYTFQLRDKIDYVAVSPGLKGAAPAVDQNGRLLGVTGDLSEKGYSLGYLVPVASLRVVASSVQQPVSIPVLAASTVPLWVDRNTVEGLSFRGALLATTGKFEEARNFLTLAVKKDANSPDAHFWMGRVLFSQQQLEAAADEFQKAAQLDPTFHMAWHMAGAAYHQANRYLDAEKMYGKALEVKPDAAGTYCNLGGTYFSERRFDKAVESFRKSISLDPRYQMGLAYRNLAQTYVAMGQRTEAEQVYGDLVKINPEWARSLRTVLDAKK